MCFNCERRITDATEEINSSEHHIEAKQQIGRWPRKTWMRDRLKILRKEQLENEAGEIGAQAITGLALALVIAWTLVALFQNWQVISMNISHFERCAADVFSCIVS